MRPLVEESPIKMNEEFERAIKPFMHDLRKYCLSLTNTKWDGEDLMQDTLVKAYGSWLKVSKQMSKAYLYRIASNAWIDKHRKRKIEEDMNQNLDALKQEPDPESELHIPTIHALLTQLSAKQRAVVLFVLGFGYTAKETAKLLSDSEGSVKAALHRARKNIKQIQLESIALDLDEDISIPYITALRDANPEAILRLYQKETQEPSMHIGNNISRSPLTTALHSIGANGICYVLISHSTKNGIVLFVPFYRQELFALLSQITRLQKEELLVA